MQERYNPALELQTDIYKERYNRIDKVVNFNLDPVVKSLETEEEQMVLMDVLLGKVMALGEEWLGGPFLTVSWMLNNIATYQMYTAKVLNELFEENEDGEDIAEDEE